MNFYAIGTGLLVIASVGSITLVNRKSIVSERQVRWVAFVLYFWLLVFLQLMLFAGYYALWVMR